MRAAIGAAAAIMLMAGGACAGNPRQPAGLTAQPAASGMALVRRAHGKLAGFPVHGKARWAARGKTKPGSTVRSAERNGAEPTGMTPPVPAPTVEATGGRVPYAR